MRTIAVINQKGGSGKTTTAVNLAAGLAENKRNVLLIDLDPQGSTSSWLGVSDGDGKSLYDVFVNKVHIDAIITRTEVEYLDAVPASNWLFGLDKALAHEVGSETILKQQFKKLSGKYDYVLIDCPPNLGILTINALTAVQEVIIPVEARVMALSGLVQLMQTIDVIKERLNKDLHIAGIVPCRVDGRTKHAKEVVSALESNFKGMLYKTAIRENVRLSEAPSFTKPITEYDTRSYGAFDYRSLASEVILQEQKQTVIV
ncbi:MAG: ParA family protein [Candidatus Babeliales bacterium]